MPLTTDDLFRLEVQIRIRAHELRSSWPKDVLKDPGTSPGFRELARRDLAAADDWDQVGDILLGLQGCWGSMSNKVRDGYKRMAAGYNLAMKGVEPPKPEETETAA